MTELMKNGCKELDLELSEEMEEKFETYSALIREWNERMNLTTITDEREIDIKHFLDSLTLLKTGLFEGEKRIIDLGTGAGFPGIPLKIMRPKLDLTLMDSLNKRMIFLNEVISILRLRDIGTHHGRAEEMGRVEEFREQYDICTSRAVAEFSTLLEYCLPFVKVGGYFIAMKGLKSEEEIEAGKNAIKTLGGKFEEKIDITIPYSDITHSIIIIKKIKNTADKYPRGGGKPKSKPL